MAKPTQVNVAEEELRRMTSIDPENIQQDFVSLPGDLAFCNSKYADALGAMFKAQRFLDQTEAELRLEFGKDKIELKLTEKAIDAMVEGDAVYRQARVDSDNTEVEKARWMGVVDAVRARRDMLISFGTHVRAEMERDLIIKKRSS